MARTIISEREAELPASIMGKLISMAAEDKTIISLGPGEPDFSSPQNIIRAAKKSLSLGETHYSPPAGRYELRNAISKKLKKDNKIEAGPENIIVTSGSTEAISLVLMAIIDPGEGVLITDPGFLAYKPAIEVLTGMPISIPLKEENQFQINMDDMKGRIIPEKTNAMILNTPMNPTGTVLSRSSLEEIADFAIENDIMIISDEAYEKLVYDDEKHISIGSLNGMQDRVITLQTFSKTYAMPGFRLGYAAGPEKIIKAMTKLHLFSTICAPTVSQFAGLEALTGTQKPVEMMKKEYNRRRKMILKRLKEIKNFSCIEPKGAFYVFPNIKEFGMSSLKFSEWLIKNAKVATVPGTEFGMNGEGYLRLSYATEYKLIEKALSRIENAVKKL